MNINYTYYENYDLLEKIIKHYEPWKDDNNFKFAIIDDGSQKQPLTRSVVPDWWKVYRVKEDLGWGNEICRNVLMRRTDRTWNALMDLDYVIDLNDKLCYDALTVNFQKYYSQMFRVKVIFQFMYGTRVSYEDYTQTTPFDPNRFISINSFIVSKDVFLSTHGYDTSFGYTYGYDFTLFRQIDRESRIPDSKLIKIASQATKPGERPPPGDKSAFKEFNALRKRYIDEGVYNIKSGWINEEERLKRCTPLPDVEIL